MSFSLLLVEPYADSREMYTAYFEHHGITVHACEEPGGAIALAPSVDAVVMAGRLPSERGALALIEALRAAPQTSDLPIVLLSGTGSGCDAHRATSAGCDHVITIPCSLDDLLWTVRRAIARRRFKTPRMIRTVAAQTRSRARLSA